MIFAIDYDDTITEAPVLWANWASKALELGHEVYVVTARMRTLDPWEPVGWAKSVGAKIFFTEWRAKKPFMLDKGIDVDVWIDDRPEAIHASWDGHTRYIHEEDRHLTAYIYHGDRGMVGGDDKGNKAKSLCE